MVAVAARADGGRGHRRERAEGGPWAGRGAAAGGSARQWRGAVLAVGHVVGVGVSRTVIVLVFVLAGSLLLLVLLLLVVVVGGDAEAERVVAVVLLFVLRLLLVLLLLLALLKLLLLILCISGDVGVVGAKRGRELVEVCVSRVRVCVRARCGGGGRAAATGHRSRGRRGTHKEQALQKRRECLGRGMRKDGRVKLARERSWEERYSQLQL